MEEEKKRLLAKGGLLSDWEAMVTRGLSSEDLEWKDGYSYGAAILRWREVAWKEAA